MPDKSLLWAGAVVCAGAGLALAAVFSGARREYAVLGLAPLVGIGAWLVLRGMRTAPWERSRQDRRRDR